MDGPILKKWWFTLDTGLVSCPNGTKNHEWYLSSGASPPSPDSITTSKIPYLTKASLAQIPGSIQRRKLHSNDHNKIMSLARYLFNFGFNRVIKNMTSKKKKRHKSSISSIVIKSHLRTDSLMIDMFCTGCEPELVLQTKKQNNFTFSTCKKK